MTRLCFALVALPLGLLLGCGDPCDPSGWSCSDDARRLTTCRGDQSVTIDCYADQGRFCENNACVDPWRYGSPNFPTCSVGTPLATPESLAEKAAYYDSIATRLHLNPALGFVLNVTLPGVDPAEPLVAEADATHADVAEWNSGENDGLWSSLYLASQAYRYAATNSGQALATIERLLDGEQARMRVTGVPGIFTRQFIPPNVTGLVCPSADEDYVPDVEKDDNQWVQVRDDGCVWIVDRTSRAWTKTDHCGLDAFAGYCWLDNVSKDEYAGHMFALGALLRLVDDPEVQARVKQLLGDVGRHLVEHGLKLTDWDGRVTEHGRFLPFSFDDFPGFNAAMAIEYLSISAEATGDAAIRSFLDDCVLMRSGPRDCFDSGLVELPPFQSFLPAAGMYVGTEGCRSNYNNISMHALSMHHLIWFSSDEDIRVQAQKSFDEDVMRAPAQPRAAINHNNAWFDFMWAAQKKLGPGSDGPAFDAVDNGICMLKEFRAGNSSPELSSLPARYQPYCKNRFDQDVAELPRSAGERCASTFLWWGDPYSLSTCTLDRRQIRQPSGFLLPYWMGRYYGFVGEML